MSTRVSTSIGSADDALRAVARAPLVEPPRLAPRPGDRLARFVLLRRLGAGASGVVFAARDEVLGREVAIKVLVREGSAAADERLLREARALARVGHPEVATLLEIGSDRGASFLVMELVPGRSLRHVLADGRRLSSRRASAILAGVARGAGAAHAAGVVHGDLKPENVVVSGERVKVLDFGLARSLDARDGGGRFAGTVGYAPPDAEASGVDPRFDQFAIGVMIVEAILGVSPEDARANVDALPRPLRAVARRALAPRAGDRYASCDVLADQLAAHAREAPIARRGSIGWAAFPLASLALGASTREPIRATAVSAIRDERPLACVPFETASPDDGWLGAAAASLACRRLRSIRGGAIDDAIPPGGLLDLPRAPGPSFPHDPYALPRARAEATTRAEAVGARVVDGAVAHHDGVIEVAITIDDVRVVGRARGLAGAVRQATEGLVAHEAVARAADLAPDAFLWSGATDVAALVARSDASSAFWTGSDLAWATERVTAARPGLVSTPDPLERMLRDARGVPDDPSSMEVPSIPCDGSDELLVTACLAEALRPGGDPADVAARLDVALARTTDERAGFELRVARAAAHLFAGDRERAASGARAAIEVRPWDGPWDVLVSATYATPAFVEAGWGYVGHLPEVADAWNVVAQDPALGDAERLSLLGRAYLLGPEFPLVAGNYGRALVRAGRIDEARRVASRLDQGSPAERGAAARLAMDIDVAAGKYLGAYERGRALLEAQPTVGSVERGDVVVLADVIELGILLGRGAETAAWFTTTFLAPDPPRLGRGIFVPTRVAHACALATTDVAARCFRRLDALLETRWFDGGSRLEARAFVEGARALARGDAATSAGWFRRMRSEVGFAERTVAAIAFERAGDPDAAARIDPPRPGLFRGASMSRARHARRLLARGECEAGRSLAAEITSAWSEADVRVPLAEDLASRAATCRAGRG